MLLLLISQGNHILRNTGLSSPVLRDGQSAFYSSVLYSWVLDLLSEMLSQAKSSLDLLFWQLYQTKNYYLQKSLTIYPTFLLSNWVPGYLSLLEKNKSLHVQELNYFAGHLKWTPSLSIVISYSPLFCSHQIVWFLHIVFAIHMLSELVYVEEFGCGYKFS